MRFLFGYFLYYLEAYSIFSRQTIPLGCELGYFSETIVQVRATLIAFENVFKYEEVHY